MTDTKPARDPAIVAVAERAAEHFNGEKGHDNTGKRNVYICEDSGIKKDGRGCGRATVTIDREPGVTPFMSTCPHCGGGMVSRMYRVPQDLIPTVEWYRPDTLDGLSPWTVDHVMNGGLISRWIDSAGEDLMAAYEEAVRRAQTSSPARIGHEVNIRALQQARAALVAAVGPQRFNDDQIRRIVKAHDQEDSAQRGEPSLWDLRQRGDFANELPQEDARQEAWDRHVAERMAAMRAGLKAVERA